MFTLIKAVTYQLRIPTMVGLALTTVGAAARLKRLQKKDVVVPIEHEGQMVGLAVGHLIDPMDLRRPQYAQAREIMKTQIEQGMVAHPSVTEALHD